ARRGHWAAIADRRSRTGTGSSTTGTQSGYAEPVWGPVAPRTVIASLMGSFLQGVAVVLVFAWLGRAILDARSVTWGRLTLAALGGISLGYLPALLLLAPDFSNVPEGVWPQIRLLAVPFQIVAT